MARTIYTNEDLETTVREDVVLFDNGHVIHVIQ